VEEADAVANEGLEMDDRQINDTKESARSDRGNGNRGRDGLSKRRTEDGWINRKKARKADNNQEK